MMAVELYSAAYIKTTKILMANNFSQSKYNMQALGKVISISQGTVF